MRVLRTHSLLAIALAAAVSVPAIAEAQRRDHRGGGPRASSPGRVYRSQMRPPRTTRPRVRDHRGVTVRPPRGDRPYVWRHRHYYYWPYWGFGYGPYYYGEYYAPYYYGPPATAEVIAPPPPPRPRSVLAVGVHVGQLDGENSGDANLAGLALRWRGAMLEGELELGRRVYDADLRERSLAATLYLNLGRRDAFHPYLLGGVGALERDRVFGALGAGLALPVASRLTVAGDLRVGSIAPREMTDARIEQDAERTFEGRIGLLLDF